MEKELKKALAENQIEGNSNELLQSIGDSKIAKAMRRYGLLAMLVIASKFSSSQIDNSRPTDSVQLTQINNLGSISFNAQGDSTIQKRLNEQALYMQQAYKVHVDLDHTIIRSNYVATNLTESGNAGTDANAIAAWQLANFPTADTRDARLGCFIGNSSVGSYGGVAGDQIVTGIDAPLLIIF